MNAAKELAILIGIISVSGIVHVTAQEGPLTLQYASLVSHAYDTCHYIFLHCNQLV